MRFNGSHPIVPKTRPSPSPLRPQASRRAVLLAFSVAVLGLQALPARTARAETAAAETAAALVAARAKAFYSWYLGVVTAERDPLSDERKALKGFVAKALIAKLDRLSRSEEGLSEDYFLKAQDIMEDWAANIEVSDVRADGKSGSTAVQLGASAESRQRLTVDWTLEAGLWKVSKVGQ